MRILTSLRMVCNSYAKQLLAGQSSMVFRNYGSKDAARALVKLEKVTDLGEGDRNFLLLTVYQHGDTLFGKTVVRAAVESHVELFDRLQAEFKEKELCVKPLGGGMMKVDCNNVTLFGQCKTFGQACPFRTREIMKGSRLYRNHKISIKPQKE